MTAVIVIVAIGLGTYALRVAMFALVTVKPLPGRLSAALRLVGPAAVAALVATLSLTREGSIAPLPLVELLAIVAGFSAVHRSGNVVRAFAAGMPVFWILSQLG